jgi:hypothetical protein
LISVPGLPRASRALSAQWAHLRTGIEAPRVLTVPGNNLS